MLLPGRIYIALGPWHLGYFRNIFLPNIGEDQKKSFDFSSEPLAGTQARSQKFAMGMAVLVVWWQAPSRRRPMGVRGEAPSCRRLGVWGRASSAQKFCIFFAKIT